MQSLVNWVCDHSNRKTNMAQPIIIQERSVATWVTVCQLSRFLVSPRWTTEKLAEERYRVFAAEVQPPAQLPFPQVVLDDGFRRSYASHMSSLTACPLGIVYPDHLLDVSLCAVRNLSPFYPCTPTFGHQSVAVG